MLKDIAEKYYIQGYNCAESLIRAGNEYYNLNLDENALTWRKFFTQSKLQTLAPL